MRLSRATGYALKVLIECARMREDLVTVGHLSERLDITQQNVFKIVNSLTRAGFLQSLRGRNGGVRLAHDPGSISIGEVVRSIEITGLEIEEPLAVGGKNVNRIFDDAMSAFMAVLNEHTLADFLGTGRSRPARATKRPTATRRAAPIR